MPQSFVRVPIHVIFATKNREATLSHDVRPRLFGYIGGIINECGGVSVVVNGMAEHVHVLMLLPSDRSVSEVLRLIKSNSSKWIHEQFPSLQGFAWQTGYAAFGVSESNIESVMLYIRNQEEHHRMKSFTEEYETFLALHGFEQHPNDLAA